jgi:hypothetical protein
MPASAFAEWIFKPMLEFLFEIAFEFGCYWIGRIVVPIATLGQVHCDPLLADKSSDDSDPLPYWREKLIRRENGHLILSATATQWVGLGTAVLIAGVWIAAAIYYS